MSWGHITNDMWAAIAPVVKGKQVWDICAGDLEYAHLLAALGASVTAVEKEGRTFGEDARKPKQDGPVTVYRAYLHDLTPPDHIEVLFGSYIPNAPLPTLIRYLEAAETIIYIGCNTGGTACGNPVLYKHLFQRNILHHITTRQNDLIIYGNGERGDAPLLPEEFAAMCDRQLSYEEAQDAMKDPGWRLLQRAGIRKKLVGSDFPPA